MSRKEEDKIKQGREEDMTVRLLREVLDEMGVVFNRTSNRAELIQKVKARKEKSNATDSSPSSQGTEMASLHERYKATNRSKLLSKHSPIRIATGNSTNVE